MITGKSGTATVSSRSLDDLEAEFAATLKNDLPNVIRRGELLRQIKDALKRGEWLPWLADKFAAVGEHGAELHERRTLCGGKPNRSGF